MQIYSTTLTFLAETDADAIEMMAGLLASADRKIQGNGVSVVTRLCTKCNGRGTYSIDRGHSREICRSCSGPDERAIELQRTNAAAVPSPANITETPTPKGKIPEPSPTRLEEHRRWMAEHGAHTRSFAKRR